MRRSSLVAFLLAVALAGCTSRDSESSATFTVRDSAGIQIVESAAPLLGPDEAWTLSEEPLLQIGAVEGEDPYLFGRVADTKPLGEGKVAVLEGHTLEIRVFDSTGAFLATVGGRGEGPGEFSVTPKFIALSGDTILTWDPSLQRRQWFTPDGTLLDDDRLSMSLRNEGIGRTPISPPWAVAPDGSLMVRDLTYVKDGTPLEGRPTGPGFFESKVVYHLIRNLGREVSAIPDTFPWRQAVRRGEEMAEAELDSDLEWMSRYPVNLSNFEAAWASLPMPDSTPAIGEIFWDGSDHLFVQRWTWNLADDGGPTLFDIVGTDGQWVGTLPVPLECGDPVSVAPGRLVTLWRDEWDVPYVRVYALGRGD